MYRLSATLLALSVFAACGGAPVAPEPEVTGPFTEEHERLFADGLDLIYDPGALEGPWRDQWDHDLDDRVVHADAIAVVTIRTLRTDVDLDRRQTFRLITQVEATWLGELGEELMLIAREGEPGFGTIQPNERRLLDQSFVVYLRWFRETNGTVRARWHLSPANDQLARRTRELLRLRRQVVDEETARRRVTVHRN